MRHKIAFSISWWNHGFFRNVEIMKINGLTSLALIGGKTSCELLDSKSPHFHPHAWARPNHADFSSEILATYDRARRGRPPEANDKKLLNIIGFDRWKTLPGPLHRHRPPITHHPPPPRYNEPLHTPPRPNDPTHRGRQTLRPQNTLREPGLAGHLQ